MIFPRRERPWGWYETLTEGERYKVKRLYIAPNQRLSLQYHNLRTEDWVIVEGGGVVTQNRLETPCKIGDTFHISTEMKNGPSRKIGMYLERIQEYMVIIIPYM